MSEDLNTKLRYVRRFNLGSYQHEEIEISIEGPFEKIKGGNNLVAELVQTSTALGTLAMSVYLENRKNDATIVPPKA